MFFQFSTLLTCLHLAIVLGISLRVIMRRPPAGVALAWMFVVLSLPLVGWVLYMLIGERRTSGCGVPPANCRNPKRLWQAGQACD